MPKKSKPAESVLNESPRTGETPGKSSSSRHQPALTVKESVAIISQHDNEPRESAPGGTIRIGLDPEEREVVIESLIFRRNHIPAYLQAFHRKLDVIKSILKKLEK